MPFPKQLLKDVRDCAAALLGTSFIQGFSASFAAVLCVLRGCSLLTCPETNGGDPFEETLNKYRSSVPFPRWNSVSSLWFRSSMRPLNQNFPKLKRGQLIYPDLGSALMWFSSVLCGSSLRS